MLRTGLVPSPNSTALPEPWSTQRNEHFRQLTGKAGATTFSQPLPTWTHMCWTISGIKQVLIFGRFKGVGVFFMRWCFHYRGLRGVEGSGLPAFHFRPGATPEGIFAAWPSHRSISSPRGWNSHLPCSPVKHRTHYKAKSDKQLCKHTKVCNRNENIAESWAKNLQTLCLFKFSIYHLY